MAGSKFMYGLLRKEISTILAKRGFASSSTSQQAATSSSSSSSTLLILKKSGGESSKSWAPDPVTGYYRPANHSKEIDAVELRRLLLNNKTPSPSPSPSPSPTTKH